MTPHYKITISSLDDYEETLFTKNDVGVVKIYKNIDDMNNDVNEVMSVNATSMHDVTMQLYKYYLNAFRIRYKKVG